MARIFKEALLFAVCLQLACYLAWAFNIFNGYVNYPFGSVDALKNVFNINAYAVLITGLGAAGITIIGLLLKQGVYAIYAMLIFAFGVLFNFTGTFFLAIPNTIAGLIPVSANPPNSPVIAGVVVNPLIVAIGVIFSYAAYWFLTGVVLQRDV